MEPISHQMVWLRAFQLTFVELFAVVYIFYLVLIVIFFYKREIGFGIICSFCAVFCPAEPIGVLLALLFGWFKAAQLQIRTFMAFWTVLVALAILNLAVALVIHNIDMMTWERYFGPRE